MTWRITVRDAALAEIGEVDQFKALEIVPRFNATGTWSLTIPARLPGADFDPAAELVAGSGIVVRRDGSTVFSGPLTGPVRTWDKDTDEVVAAGVSDDVHLDDRLAYPSAPPFTAAAYDVRTGAAETVMRAYVNANAGPGALAARQILSLDPDLGRGGTVTGRARFNVLSDLLRSLAVAGGELGFGVEYRKGAGLFFVVYEPRDLASEIIFSPGIGNLKKFSYEDRAGEGNHVIVGGSGEETARVFVEAEDSTSIARWGRRIEIFKDRRDTADTGELGQAGVEELANRAEQTRLSIEPADTEAVTYLRDYTLGDRVSVEVDGVRISDVVREVKIQLTGEGGEVITPAVGSTGSSTPGLRFFDELRSVRRRVSNIERR